MPTFAGHFLKRKSWGKNFLTMATFGRSLFETDFLGKKIYDKLFGLYSKKPPGTGGGGGSGGEYRGEYPGLLAGYCGDFLC